MKIEEADQIRKNVIAVCDKAFDTVYPYEVRKIYERAEKRLDGKDFMCTVACFVNENDMNKFLEMKRAEDKLFEYVGVKKN